MKKRKSKLHRLGYKQYLVPLLFVSGFAITGSLLLFVSFAATDNPMGFADSCYLDGATTVVRGWAHDSSAGSGPNPNVQVTIAGRTVTVPTSVANYRQAEIDAALNSRGITTAGTYGFEARFSGLYKGTGPVVNGTIFNVGAGANQNLEINNFNPNAGGTIFLSGNVVPDACLASLPSPAPTPSTPAPATPKPTPAPIARRQTPAPTPSPAPSNPAPAATPPAPQTPTAYAVTLSFFSNSAEATDVKATLEELNLTATADKNQVTFNDIPPGTYTAHFDYQGKDYSYTLQVPASESGQATASADGKTLSYTIDLARLSAPAAPQPTPSPQTPAKSKGRLGHVAALFSGLLFIVVALAAAIIFVRRYRSRRKSTHDDAHPRWYEQPAAKPAVHKPSPHDPALHTGISLKDMVIESMRKEAANRQRNDPPKE